MTLWFAAFNVQHFETFCKYREQLCLKKNNIFFPISFKVSRGCHLKLKMYFFSICVFPPPGCQPPLDFLRGYLTGWSQMHVRSQLLSLPDNIHTLPTRDINRRRGVWFIASRRTSPFQEENDASSIQPQLQAQISVSSNVGHLKLTLLHAH